MALRMKTAVTDSDNLVDQETVEFNCHRYGERQPRAHTRRVSFHGLTKVIAQFRELLDEWLRCFGIRSIHSADKPEIIHTGQAALERAAEGKRPGNAHGPLNLARAWQFRAANHPN